MIADRRSQSAAKTRYADADSEVGREQRYWLRNLYVGFAGYLGIASIIFLYAGITWSAPNRGWIVLATLAALTYLTFFYLIRHRIVTTIYRPWIFIGGTIGAFVFITPICALDGGIASPLTYLFVPPIVYLAISYPLRSVMLCGSSIVACYAGLVWLSDRPLPYFVITVQLLVLCDSLATAMLGAMYRDQKDHDLSNLRQRLEVIAATDELTGCANQRAFTAALTREVAQSARHGHWLSLLAIDVDHFKQVNDRYGHMMGDEVLRKVGGILRETARRSDIVGRPGGDELGLLAPETDDEAARALAERILQRVVEVQLPVDITLSIGICSMVPETDQAAMLFRRADQALYEAKRHGRNRMVVFEQTTDANQLMAVGSKLL